MMGAKPKKKKKRSKLKSNLGRVSIKSCPPKTISLDNILIETILEKNSEEKSI